MSTENDPNGQNAAGNPTPDGYTPFRIDTSQPPVDSDRMTLFWIDEQEYTGPKQITGALALQAIDLTVRVSAAAGAWHCLVEAIGKDAVSALLECKQLSYDQASGLLSQISAMYYGQAVALVGK